MQIENLIPGTKFSFEYEFKLYKCEKASNNLNTGARVAVYIENPEPYWSYETNSQTNRRYYLISKSITLAKLTIHKQLSKEEIIQTRIKKLWNESNYVKNNPHLIY